MCQLCDYGGGGSYGQREQHPGTTMRRRAWDVCHPPSLSASVPSSGLGTGVLQVCIAEETNDQKLVARSDTDRHRRMCRCEERGQKHKAHCRHGVADGGDVPEVGMSLRRHPVDTLLSFWNCPVCSLQPA